jgi:hypothetical protein
MTWLAILYSSISNWTGLVEVWFIKDWALLWLPERLRFRSWMVDKEVSIWSQDAKPALTKMPSSFR